jgi:hypothetical protein
MHTPDYGRNTVEEMTGHQAEASHALRSYHVDVTASHNLPMYEVANTVTVPTDEMLAVMEYRMRHAAQKLRKV